MISSYLYYSVVILFACLTLTGLGVLVMENSRLSGEQKHRFCDTYLVVAVAAIAEWLSVVLNNTPEWTRVIHNLSKCLDYTLSPAVAMMFMRQLSQKQIRVVRYLNPLLIINGILQVMSIFTGWIYYIDENNVYRHGPIHIVYIVISVLAIVLTLLAFVEYGMHFRHRNNRSLYAAGAIIFASYAIQEIGGNNARVLYLGLSVVCMMMYVHFSEYNEMLRDDYISEKEKMLQLDSLTGLYSRYAYNQRLQSLERQKLPGGFTVFSIDVNGLKQVNDSYGHLAGDELIQGAADLIRNVFETYGSCYRTGGDEFIVLLDNAADIAPPLQQGLLERAAGWHGKDVSDISLAAGYAIAKEHADMGIEQLIFTADQAMYAAKARYYADQNNNKNS